MFVLLLQSTQDMVRCWLQVCPERTRNGVVELAGEHDHHKTIFLEGVHLAIDSALKVEDGTGDEGSRHGCGDADLGGAVESLVLGLREEGGAGALHGVDVRPLSHG